MSNNTFKRVISLLLALSLLLFPADAFPKTAAYAAGGQITAYDIEELIRTAPKYPQYYTDTSAARLEAVLDEARNADLESLSESELIGLYEKIKEALNGLQYKTAEVPQVYISTANENGNTLEKAAGYVETSAVIVDTDGSVISDDRALIKVRGNTTAKGLKKPFTVKFSEKRDVLGMGKAKKWVLLANCFDPTLLRNYIALELAEELGLEYTSEKRFVELWTDGVFKGCYLLTEPVEEGKTRVDIDTDSGDFLIEYESARISPGETYIAPYGLRFTVKEPDEPTETQTAYIRATVKNIIKILKKGNYDKIKKVIDTDSFVKYYILNEYLKNADFGYSSVFYYYKSGKLYAGPVWDHDLSAANTDPLHDKRYEPCISTDGLCAYNDQLYKYLYNCEGFRDEVKKTYDSYKTCIESIYSENGLIDTVTDSNRAVFERNFSAAGWDVSALYIDMMKRPYATYEENTAFLKSWLSERDEWLAGNWDFEAKTIQHSPLLDLSELSVSLDSISADPVVTRAALIYGLHLLAAGVIILHTAK